MTFNVLKSSNNLLKIIKFLSDHAQLIVYCFMFACPDKTKVRRAYSDKNYIIPANYYLI